jgi:xanthine/CO dehydrogenase XdhC/CoxF family maturation factor
MKEIRAIVNAYNTIDFSSTRAVLATVARVEGSSYRRTGARMLVLDNGTYLGGISGGCLEGDALRRARKALVLEKPAVITYDTTQEDSHQIGVGLGCNGIIDVLFTPLDNSDEQNPVRLLSGLTDKRESSIVVTVTECSDQLGALGKTILFKNDDQFLESFVIQSIGAAVLEDIRKCSLSQRSQTIVYPYGDGSIKIFIEVILPVTHLVIYGGNADIYCMVRVGRELGWDATVVTNLAKAEKQLFSMATRVIHNKGVEEPVVDNHTAILLMSHDYETDFRNLKKALQTSASYIGLLGPKKRSDKMFGALSGAGEPVSPADLERIFSPAGLDIGANTPEEIALSIAAEVRSHFAGRKGMSLRLREGTIYEN